MKFGRETDWHEVVLEWLRSEGGQLPLTPAGRRRLLGSDANTKDAWDNAERLCLLRVFLRRFIITDLLLLPPDTNLTYNAPVVEAQIEEADISKLFIVPSDNWYDVTKGTFLVAEAAANVVPESEHWNGVSFWQRKLADYNAQNTDEMLILIAPTKDGPYTIIDGNHRAIALYRNHSQNASLPWNSLLVVHPNIANSRWNIESPSTSTLISKWRQDGGPS